MTSIFPSLLALDFSRLAEGLDDVEKAGARTIHVDVLDGHFGPEVTVGLPVIESLRKSTALRIDVRLAVEKPERYVTQFTEAGASRVAVHPETTCRLFEALCSIREHGAEAGVAVGPGIPLTALDDVWEALDFVTIVCSPWNRRQEVFIPASIHKIKAASKQRANWGGRFQVQAEGGINLSLVRELAASGTDIIVAGSAAFNGVRLGDRFKELSHHAEGARQ